MFFAGDWIYNSAEVKKTCFFIIFLMMNLGGPVLLQNHLWTSKVRSNLIWVVKHGLGLCGQTLTPMDDPEIVHCTYLWTYLVVELGYNMHSALL